MARYRVGLIGCGRIARVHARAYGQVASTVLVAGADPDVNQQSAFSAEFPTVRLYGGYCEMFEQEDLDLVSVCTWPPLHEQGVIAAAERKVRGILCEKPMALNLAQVDHMLEACERHGVRLIVGHQRRFNQRYMEAKAALDRGEIGDLQAIYATSGDTLLTCGTHTVDLIRFFANDVPIAWVMGQIHRNPARGTTMDFGHEVEQAAIGRICFRNGLRALMEQGEATRGGEERWRRHWHVILTGTQGRVEVDGDKKREQPWPTGWRVHRFGDAGWEEHLTPDEPNPFAIEIRELVRWIEKGGEHLLSGENARADHEVLMAIYESARRRCRVDLPLQVSENPLIAMIEAGEI